MSVRIVNATLMQADDELCGEGFNLEIKGDRFLAITKQASKYDVVSNAKPLTEFKGADVDAGAVFDAKGAVLVPGLVDVHIHSRDPGLTAKEDWQTLAASAFKGGLVHVCDMPNTTPPTLDIETVQQKAALARRSGIGFGIYAGVSEKNVDALGALFRKGLREVCGIKVYLGHSTGNMMFDCLDKLDAGLGPDLNPIIVFHAEDQCCIEESTKSIDQSLLRSDEFDSFRAHTAMRSSESALKATKRVLKWARETERKIHIAHVSTAEEAREIAAAAADGVDVTAEVAPHHLLLSTDDYEQWGPYIKVNPPVRDSREVEDLRDCVKKGMLGIFATDHAPHTRAEKETILAQSPSGIPAVEFFLPLLFASAKACGISFIEALKMAGVNPVQRFGLGLLGQIRSGYQANFSWVKLGTHSIAQADVEAKCGWSPYVGMSMPALVSATWYAGQKKYEATSRLS